MMNGRMRPRDPGAPRPLHSQQQTYSRAVTRSVTGQVHASAAWPTTTAVPPRPTVWHGLFSDRQLSLQLRALAALTATASEGHNRPHASTDHQWAGAFRAHRCGGRRSEIRCGASLPRAFPGVGDCFRPYRVSRPRAAGSCILTLSCRRDSAPRRQKESVLADYLGRFNTM